MKGWTIALVLLAAVLALGYSLTRESHADLERLESETERQLQAAAAQLDESTRKLSELRSIRPNLQQVDTELTSMRRQLDLGAQNLERLRADRPTSPDQRGRYIEERTAARDSAYGLAQAAASLAERAKVLDAFARGGQVRIQEMRDALRRVFETKNALVERGVALDPSLLDKLETLQAKGSQLQQFAREVFAAGATDAAQGRALATTIESEIGGLIESLRAIEKDLAAAGGKN